MRAAACVFGLFVWLALVHGEPARVYNISDTNILCQEFNNNQLSNLKLKPQDYAGNEFFEAIANQNFTFLGIETFGRVFKRSTGSNPHHAYGWVAAALQQILCVLRISHNVTFREVNDTDLSLIGGTDSDSTKCWRKVIDGELNFCVGDLWETRERLALTEFTSPIAMERVYTITEETSSSAESRPGTWFKVFNAFDRDVWIYIVVHSILLGFVISVVEFDFPGSWQDWKSNFWHVGQRFCERPRPRGFLWLMGKESREIQTRSGRWLALILSFYVLVVTTTYTGKVASDLTRSTTTYFVDDIEDALTNGKQICALAALNSTLLLQFPDLKAQNLLQTSTEYPEMYSKYYSGTTDCRVFVGADTSLNDYYNYTDCNLTAVSSEFWIPLGWPCQPTHLCNVLSILIADLREGGYIRDQQKVALESNEGKPVGDCSEVSTSDDSEPLSLTSFWGFFELTWIAMAVTFVLTLSFRFLSPLIRRESRATICWPECFRCAVYADENQRLWDGTRPPFVAASWDEALNKLTPTAQANQVPKALDLTEVRGKLTDPVSHAPGGVGRSGGGGMVER